MKRLYILTLLAIVALTTTSCQKEEMGRVLTATIEQYEQNSKGDKWSGAEEDVKAYINADRYACWEEGDKVRINELQCTVSVSGEVGHPHTATIIGSERLRGQELMAFYPADMVHEMYSSSGGIVKLPHIQSYHENEEGQQVINNPMAAFCPAEGSELKFRNLCALLKVTLQGNTSVKAIQVKGIDDQMLWGEARLKLNSQGLPMLDEFTGGTNSVVLDFGEAVAIEGSKSFYIVVPAKSDFKYLTIAAITTDGSGHHTHHCKTSLLGESLSRNQIGAIRYTPDGNEDEAFFSDWMIRYTATDPVVPNCSTFERAAYLSEISSFENGSGVLLFDGPLTEIASCAFEGCSSLRTISLPGGVTTIGTSAFEDCIGLNRIDLPKLMTEIYSRVFMGCSSLSSIELPAGVTEIRIGAFMNCSSLRSITLPEGVTSIGINAFNGCSSLSSIESPAGVTEIGDNAFASCSSLGTVYVKRWFSGTEEPITRLGSEAFADCDALGTIYVPTGAGNAYKGDANWQAYEDKIEEQSF